MSSEPEAAGDHPLILIGCPYRMTTYRDCDLACVDTSFSVQIQHPRFLECVGAPESARLLGCPPVEWSQVMDHRDAMIAALELQRDAGLMESNLTILNQYVLALLRMPLEVLRAVLGQDEFPTRAVEDAAPVPRVYRVFIQIAAMGLWRPGPVTVHHYVLDVRRGRPVNNSGRVIGICVP